LPGNKTTTFSTGSFLCLTHRTGDTVVLITRPSQAAISGDAFHTLSPILHAINPIYIPVTFLSLKTFN